jgi:LacI family gluconate utilization system Gnt-I transcriptional repressor
MMEEGASAFRRLLGRVPHLDAVCVASDVLAAGAMSEAQRLGCKIPDEIAFTGFDNSDIAKYLFPGLTTVDVDAEAIGHQAAMLLMSRLAHGDYVDLRSMPSRRFAFEYRIVGRESTGSGV